MTRLFTEGFEMYTPGAMTGSFIGYMGGRIDGFCADIGQTGAYTITASLPNSTEIFARVAISVTTAFSNFVNVIAINGGSTFGMKCDSTAYWTFTVNGTLVGTYYPETAFALNTWYVVEVHFLPAQSNGYAHVKIDGYQALAFTGDTYNTSNQLTSFVIANPRAGRRLQVDDVAINDAQGTEDNSWIGDGHVLRFALVGNGTTNQWVGSDGNSVDNYALVTEGQWVADYTYVDGSTAGDRDMYALTDFDATGKIVKRVFAEAIARDTVTNGNQIKLGVRTESTVYLSSAISLTTTFATVRGSVYTTNPNTSAAWTDTQLDALEFVAEVV